MKTISALGCAADPPYSMAQTSPAVPPKVWQAIENEISGDNSFDLIRHLTLYHSPNGSNEDFEAQAKWVAEKAREYGLADVKVFWVGGTDRPWNVHSGEAWIVEPEISNSGTPWNRPCASPRTAGAPMLRPS